MDIFKTPNEEFLRMARFLHSKTSVSTGKCIILLKLAFERFKDISSYDLAVAAEKYRDYLINRKQPTDLNLIQSQLYGLMMGYL